MDAEGRSYATHIGATIIGLGQIGFLFNYFGIIILTSSGILLFFISLIMTDAQFYNIILDTLVLLLIVIYICQETYK